MRNTLSSLFNLRSHRSRFALALLLLLSSSCVLNYKPLPDARLLTPLNDWLYRGAQPKKEQDFTQLKEVGIRTVVDFRDEPKWIQWEKQKVEALGMTYVSLPWSITGRVGPELLDRFFEILDNPRNRPVFFHCKHGRDRTGVMATLALMRYEKLSEEEARELALETILPHLRYRMFVNQKIDFFLKARASQFSEATEEKIVSVAG